jgi:hypothetical protein
MGRILKLSNRSSFLKTDMPVGYATGSRREENAMSGTIRVVIAALMVTLAAQSASAGQDVADPSELSVEMLMGQMHRIFRDVMVPSRAIEETRALPSNTANMIRVRARIGQTEPQDGELIMRPAGDEDLHIVFAGTALTEADALTGGAAAEALEGALIDVWGAALASEDKVVLRVLGPDQIFAGIDGLPETPLRRAYGPRGR